MSDETLTDPHVRVSHSSWYLYYDRSPAWGGGTVRAVIEVVHGHTGMYGPDRTLRHMYIDQCEAAVVPGDNLSDAWDESTGWIPLSERLMGTLTDDEFEQLIVDGTLIPLRTPDPPPQS